jgi:hypothetical protein
MTDLNDRAEFCPPVTLSSEKAPAPSGHAHTRTHRAPAPWDPLTADCRSVSAATLASTTTSPPPAPLIHPDLKRE